MKLLAANWRKCMIADSACFLDEFGESTSGTKLRLLNALYKKIVIYPESQKIVSRKNQVLYL